MYGAPWANDWANVGPIDFFFTYGFHVLKGMVSNLKTKKVCFSILILRALF